MDLSTIRFDDLATDNVLVLPITALDQVIGSDELDKFKWCVGVKRYHQRDTGQRSQQRHAVFERIDRSTGSFFQASDRRIAVDADDHGWPYGSRLL